MIPPNNAKAEMALIGSILYDNTIIDDLKLHADDFYRQSNQEIYTAITIINKQSKKIDMVTLEHQLGDSYEIIGGFEYLNDCMTEGVISSSFKHWEHVVIQNSMLRQQIEIAKEIMDKAYAGENAQDIFRRSDNIDNYNDDELVFIKDFIHETLEDIDNYLDRKSYPGVMTKLTGLDHYMNGMKNGDLIYVGARPSMGKSALAMQIMLNVAEQDKKVAMFSLEMQNKKLANRMLVNYAKVHLNLIKNRSIEGPERKRLTDAAAKLFNQNIAISDNGTQTVSEILRKAKRHKKRFGLDVLIIDHFHLLSADGKFNGIYERRSHDSQVLKAIAKELDVPVICLCQLSRALEQRPIDKRLPMLSDLKETGSLEQDGDVIIFLDRQDYWFKDDKDHKNNHKATIFVAKNRDGETGIFELDWSGGYQRFDNI